MDKTKPKQEMKTSNYIGLLAVITIVVVLVGGLAVKNLGASFLLNQRVIAKQSTAQKVLADDVISAQAIAHQYQALGGQTQLVNDALPSETDIPGLANAIQAMASSSGTQVSSVSATTTTAATATPAAPVAGNGSNPPIPLPISIAATTNYANLPAFLAALQSSVRPITISNLTISGTNASLALSISATTYYRSPATFTTTKETVK